MALSVRMCSLAVAGDLSMLRLELAHKIHQCLYTGYRHRVVDRGAHAADRAVALELKQAALLGLLEEFLIEPRIPQAERDVHARAIVDGHWAGIEAACVEQVVEQLRLGDIDALHALQAA